MVVAVRVVMRVVMRVAVPVAVLVALPVGMGMAVPVVVVGVTVRVGEPGRVVGKQTGGDAVVMVVAQQMQCGMRRPLHCRGQGGCGHTGL